MHKPTPLAVTERPSSTHGPLSSSMFTGSPEDADALTTKGSPNATLAGDSKVIDWFLLATSPLIANVATIARPTERTTRRDRMTTPTPLTHQSPGTSALSQTDPLMSILLFTYKPLAERGSLRPTIRPPLHSQAASLLVLSSRRDC